MHIVDSNQQLHCIELFISKELEHNYSSYVSMNRKHYANKNVYLVVYSKTNNHEVLLSNVILKKTCTTASGIVYSIEQTAGFSVVCT